MRLAAAMSWPAFVIVAIELCERLAYYSFSGATKNWLQDQGVDNANSSSIWGALVIVLYVASFFGGWLGDVWGRYRTIGAVTVLYVVGCAVCACAVHPQIANVPIFLVSTVLGMIGSGGIKPNVSTFGADQIVVESGADQQKELFFRYFYLTVNVGAIVYVSLLSNVNTSGLPPLIPVEFGFFAVHIFGAFAMLCALLAFIAGTPWFVGVSAPQQTEQDRVQSFVFKFGQQLLDGAKRTLVGKVGLVGWICVPLLLFSAAINVFVGGTVMALLSFGCFLLCVFCLCVAHRKNDWMTDEELARCTNSIPVLLIGVLFFNIQDVILAQSLFVQACQMDTRIGRDPEAYQLNGIFFSLAHCFVVIVGTPLLEHVLRPFFERLLGEAVPMKLQVRAGFAVAFCAQVSALILEIARRGATVTDVHSKCAPLLSDGTHVRASDMSAFWMFLPYALTGMAELLVQPILQYHAYRCASPRAKSLMQAFYLFAKGAMPAAFTAVFYQAMKPLIPNDLNAGKFPLVYVLNMFIIVIGASLFGWAERGPTRTVSYSASCEWNLTSGVNCEWAVHTESEDSRL